MQVNISELENILNQELNVFSKLEKHLIDKKNYLIRSDIESLRNIDVEIEKLSTVIIEIESKKAEFIDKSGKKQNLSNILEELSDKNKAKTLSSLKEQIKGITLNIQKQNNINAQLIQHSLKLIEQTVLIIAKAFNPEISAYNNLGQVKTNQMQTGLSSVNQEA